MVTNFTKIKDGFQVIVGFVFPLVSTNFVKFVVIFTFCVGTQFPHKSITYEKTFHVIFNVVSDINRGT